MNIGNFRLILVQNDPVDFIFTRLYSLQKTMRKMGKEICINFCQKTILAEGPNNLKEIKYFDPFFFFARINQSLNPTFMLSLRRIGDLSCMVLQGFLMDTVSITSTFNYDNFQTKIVSQQHAAEVMYVACVSAKTSLRDT